jgi:hypothetical protein
MRFVRVVSLIFAALVLAGAADAQKSHSSRSGAPKSRSLVPHSGTGSSHKGGHYTAPRASTRAPTFKVPKPRAPSAKALKPKAPKTPKAPKSTTPSVRAPRAPKAAAPSTAGPAKRTSKGKIARSEEAKRTFEKQTGFPRGRPGYVIDHKVPLACGGADSPSNMQWQTVAEGKAKDKVERVGCGKP